MPSAGLLLLVNLGELEGLNIQTVISDSADHDH